MIASATVNPTWHLRHLLDKAGSTDPDNSWIDGDILHVTDLTQEQLDAAIAAYVHETAAAELEELRRQRLKQMLDEPELGEVLRAIAKYLVKEINKLRNARGIAPITSSEAISGIKAELD